MSHQPQYTAIAREAFSQFLDQQIDLELLIERLRDIELLIIAEDEDEEVSGKKLWFRFFEGDPLETTIPEIEKDLSAPSHPNCMILMRGIALGVESNELEVHYS
jgi:hypothetical protein